MSTNTQLPMVIEIIDSSDGESDNEVGKQVRNRLTAAAVASITDPSDAIESETPPPRPHSVESSPPPPPRPHSVELPGDKTIKKGTAKKISSRRKTVHHSIKATENLSFESVFARETAAKMEVWSDYAKRAEKAAELKKKWRNERNINAAIDGNTNDEETTRLLRKIAYCRVMTNYLLRQYDMLTIDFKLYSNLDVLMLELKKRVDTYSAIMSSRQRLSLLKSNNRNK